VGALRAHRPFFLVRGIENRFHQVFSYCIFNGCHAKRIVDMKNSKPIARLLIVLQMLASLAVVFFLVKAIRMLWLLSS
jgi:hypothetical protein